ncbi:MAG: hypothetical protein CO012_04270 [Syntrophobacterales bacterium CG_4_8_14_3_um_filter_49_14]|nr:MAG: hypothetical protein COX52_10725 [Syntrophobacterales bacterium CG23_combo_of_CG06-09_8_20_14_all_48_27]PJA50649.1 MAG: hypothetical protein CO171_00525 [Syntrophobacterales bacterium CG_4_9_14_3_um_filter_49_8]PJC75101.1 MAG: hypothetical protein CO012_04270 [Syntrophobacterales bacterium CG_4_8_14_3_um_filter_49_14]
MKRILRHVLGWFFVVLGIVGLFLPILQGILFILVGITILAPEIPLFRRLLSKLRHRYPLVFEKAERLMKKYRSK